MEIALAKLAEILKEKTKEQSSPRRQRERVEEEDNYGSYKPAAPIEYIGTRESFMLTRWIRDKTEGYLEQCRVKPGSWVQPCM